MFRSRLLWRLFASHVAIILLSTMVVGLMVSRQVIDNGMQEIHHSLEVRAILIAEVAKQSLTANSENGLLDSAKNGHVDLSSLSLQKTIERVGRNIQSRITVIDSFGVVIADSQELPMNMDNHGQRPEIIDARVNGAATASRYSQTLQQQMIYRALKISENNKTIGFVRVSLPMRIINEKLAQLRLIVAFGAGVSALVALLLGFYFAKRISDPLINMTEIAEAMSKGDYQRRIGVDQNDEIGKLGKAFNRLARSSEQRMTEIINDRNRLAMTFAGMVEGVIGVDQDQNIIHINQAAAKLLNLSATESINKSMWRQVRAVEINRALEQAIQTRGVVNSQMRIASEEGDQVVDIYAATLINQTNEGGENNFSGAVVVLNDISNLDQLEKVRRDFVANASHELKTPITAIRGMAETILDDADMLPETQTNFIERIHAQSIRLSFLVTDLMMISRLENDQNQQYFQRIDFVEIVRSSMAELDSAASDKQLSLSAQYSDDNVAILGDGQVISQLVDNLVGNAIKYTARGGSVVVKVEKLNQFVELSVTDNGIGINPQHQGRVFERFYRVDSARSRELGGTGLGLSIVKNIADQHGGSVSLVSVPDSGSTFKVKLPLA